MPGGVEDAGIQFEWFSDPKAKLGMIGQVIIRQRVHQGPEARILDRANDFLDGPFKEMNFELRGRMRPHGFVHHSTDEQHFAVVRKHVAQSLGVGAVVGRIIDVGVIWGVGAGHWQPPSKPQACG